MPQALKTAADFPAYGQPGYDPNALTAANNQIMNANALESAAAAQQTASPNPAINAISGAAAPTTLADSSKLATATGANSSAGIAAAAPGALQQNQENLQAQQAAAAATNANAPGAGTAAGAYESNALKQLSPELTSLFSSMTGSLGGPGTGASGTPASIAAIAPANPTAANAAAFAQAKNQVGATSRASLQALNDELGAQGTLGAGSGAQAAGTTSLIESGAGQLGQTANQEAINQASLANTDILANQSSAVTQRGQDIQSQEAAAQLELARQTQAQNTALSLLKTITGSITVPQLY